MKKTPKNNIDRLYLYFRNLESELSFLSHESLILVKNNESKENKEYAKSLIENGCLDNLKRDYEEVTKILGKSFPEFLKNTLSEKKFLVISEILIK